MKMYQERMTENTVFCLPPEIVNSVSLQRFLYVYIYSCIYLFIYLFSLSSYLLCYLFLRKVGVMFQRSTDLIKCSCRCRYLPKLRDTDEKTVLALFKGKIMDDQRI